jgi:hypothetical protein
VDPDRQQPRLQFDDRFCDVHFFPGDRGKGDRGQTHAKPRKREAAGRSAGGDRVSDFLLERSRFGVPVPRITPGEIVAAATLSSRLRGFA